MFRKGPTSEFESCHVVGGGRGRVEIRARRHGRDLLVSVGGGASHVGAVAVVSPGGGIAGESCDDCLVVPGHKEGPLASEFARRLAAVTGATCTAVVGIHIDRATDAEIATLLANARLGLDGLLAELLERGE